MADNYYQDPLGAPDYSAQGMPSLLSLSNLESLGRGSVAGLFDLPYVIEGMLRGDVDPRMPQRKRVVPSSEQVLATTPRMTQPTPQAGLLETAGAFMSPAPVAAVKPVAQAVGKGGKALGKAYLKKIDAAMMGERGGLLGAVTPQPMNIVPKGKKIMNKTEKTPKVAMTSDGYKFYEQPDGTYTNGDMTFESLDELFSTDPQLTVNGKIYSPKAYFEEEAKGTPINPLYDDLFQEPNPLTSPFADLYKKGFK